MQLKVDVEYELPKQAVTEAIVNAVAHRDYTSNGSVQVMLFADRLEVANPGSLPYELTIDKLYTAHRSIPANPLIAEAMYLNGTIERMGTGTEELVNSCMEKGLKKPDFIQENDFRTVLYRINEEKGTEKVTKNQQLILDEIIKNPYTTIEELIPIIGIGASKIKENLSKLKDKGLLERVGPDRGGSWKVLK